MLQQTPKIDKLVFEFISEDKNIAYAFNIKYVQKHPVTYCSFIIGPVFLVFSTPAGNFSRSSHSPLRDDLSRKWL